LQTSYAIWVNPCLCHTHRNTRWFCGLVFSTGSCVRLKPGIRRILLSVRCMLPGKFNVFHLSRFRINIHNIFMFLNCSTCTTFEQQVIVEFFQASMYRRQNTFLGTSRKRKTFHNQNCQPVTELSNLGSQR